MYIPEWLHWLAVLSLIAGGISFVIVVGDILAGNKQHMWIMNVVWPITALYSGPLGLWAYFTMGRLSTHERVHEAKEKGEKPPGKKKPFWQITLLATSHCGGGCTCGDVIAEWFVYFIPIFILGEKIFGTWALDFVLALLFGIAFQYFTIKPMKGLSPGEGLKAAIKADTLSLTAWQVGMYGWMAIATFGIFHHELSKTGPLFWFMMQIAMLCGLVTSFPINWFLVKKGIKEAM